MHQAAARSYLEIGERPWGQYFVLEDQPTFKVKKIVVNPGQRLSLQSHQHRAEHWTVVEGVATVEVRIGQDRSKWVSDLQVNQNCHIPLQAIHRLSNQTNQPLVIIEVQCGDYTGEDDITRYEDDYNRS